MIEANARLKPAQMAREAMKSVHRKHLKNADEHRCCDPHRRDAFQGHAPARGPCARVAPKAACRRGRCRPPSAGSRVPLGPLQRRLGAAAISPSALLRALNSGALSPGPAVRAAGRPRHARADIARRRRAHLGGELAQTWLKCDRARAGDAGRGRGCGVRAGRPWWAGVVIGAVLLGLAVLAWLLSQRCTPGAAGGRGIDLGDDEQPRCSCRGAAAARLPPGRLPGADRRARRHRFARGRRVPQPP